jgi:hypothetical protein
MESTNPFGGELSMNTFGEFGQSSDHPGPKISSCTRSSLPQRLQADGRRYTAGDGIQGRRQHHRLPSGDDEVALTGYWDKLKDLARHHPAVAKALG